MDIVRKLVGSNSILIDLEILYTMVMLDQVVYITKDWVHQIVMVYHESIRNLLSTLCAYWNPFQLRFSQDIALMFTVKFVLVL